VSLVVTWPNSSVWSARNVEGRVDKVTKSRLFAQWLADNYPELRINSLEDERGSNHRGGKAVDVSGIGNHPEKEKILKTALDLGLRIGREGDSKFTSVKKPEGYGAHYHFDETGYEGDTDVHFIRGKETGGANRGQRNRIENLENEKFKKAMLELKNKPPSIDYKKFKKKYKPMVERYIKLKNLPKDDLKNIQSELGLTPDGIFGKNTMRALLKHASGFGKTEDGKIFKDYGEQFGPSLKEIKGDLVERLEKEDSPIMSMAEEANKPVSYDELSFKDAFEQAMEDKGEGEVFEWKGKKFLLEKADKKPELEKLESIKNEIKPSFEEMLKKESDKVDDIVKEETSIKPTLKETLKPYSDTFDEVIQEEQENMEDFDPRLLELQRLENRRNDYMPKKEDMYKDGGTKYQEGSKPLLEMMDELNRLKRGDVEESRPFLEDSQKEDETDFKIKPPKQETVDSPEPKVDELKREPAEEKQEFTPSPMDKSEEYDAYKQGLAEAKPEEKEEETGFFQGVKDFFTSGDENKFKRAVARPATGNPQLDALLKEYDASMKQYKEELDSAKTKDMWMTLAQGLMDYAAYQNAAVGARAGLGIKPMKVNLQGNYADQVRKQRPDIKDTINEAKLYGADEKLTPYQKKMLEIKEQSAAKRDKYLELNRTKEDRIARQQQINTMRGFLKDDPTYELISKQRLEFDQVGDIIKQAESGNENAIAALGTKLARAMGEVGVLTDTDVVRYVQGTSWGRNLKTWWDKGAKGQLPSEVLKDIQDNIKTIDNKLKQNEERVFKRAKSRIKSAYPDLEDSVISGVLGYTKRDSSETKEPISEKTYTEAQLESAAKKSFNGDIDKAREFYESKGFRKK